MRGATAMRERKLARVGLASGPPPRGPRLQGMFHVKHPLQFTCSIPQMVAAVVGKIFTQSLRLYFHIDFERSQEIMNSAGAPARQGGTAVARPRHHSHEAPKQTSLLA